MVCRLYVVGGDVKDHLGRELDGLGREGPPLHMLCFERGHREPVVIAVGGDEGEHCLMGFAVLSFMRGPEAGHEVEVVRKPHLWGAQRGVIGEVFSDIVCEREEGKDKKNGSLNATLGDTTGYRNRWSVAVGRLILLCGLPEVGCEVVSPGKAQLLPDRLD